MYPVANNATMLAPSPSARKSYAASIGSTPRAAARAPNRGVDGRFVVDDRIEREEKGGGGLHDLAEHLHRSGVARGDVVLRENARLHLGIPHPLGLRRER